ncbi:MAG: cation transporter [Clostridia bacterium]
MKKVFKLNDLDCANCAAKMESAIQKINGVTACTVNFMTQKMSLEVADESFEHVLHEVKAVIKKVEPDCTLAN